MFRSRVINTIGLAFTARRPGDRADHQVPRRRLDHDPGDDRLLRADARHPQPLRPGRATSWPPTTRTRCCRPGCTRSCWSPSCTSRRCGRSPSPRRPGPTCSRRVYVAIDADATDAPAGGVGRAPHRRAAQGAALAVPRADPADRRVRRRDPAGQPARRRRGLHPRVRRRALVGAAAAQPDRAAAQGPAAVHPRRDGHLGALPAAVLGDRPRARGARATSGSAPATCAAAASTAAAGGGGAGEPADPRARRRAVGPASATGSRPRSVRSRTAGTASCAGSHRERAVVFVRHALPGERVVVEITEGTDGDRFWRGDAVEVLERRRRTGSTPPCPLAGPGGCGGCDFQHVVAAGAARAEGRRRRRAAAPPGRPRRRRRRSRRSRRSPSSGLLRWRTRMQYVGLPDGGRGLRKNRSHEVVAGRRLPDRAPRRPRSSAGHRGRRGPCVEPSGTGFEVAADGFWQVHPGAPRDPGRHGRSSCSRRSRGSGRSTCTPGSGCSPRSSPTPSAPSGPCLGRRGRPYRPAGLRGAATSPTCRRCRGPRRASRPGAASTLDASGPPEPSTSSCSTRRARAPASRSSTRSSTGPRVRSPTSPATRPRWPATSRYFAEHGYRLTGLRAFDLFPMTHHVECVALLDAAEP